MSDDTQTVETAESADATTESQNLNSDKANEQNAETTNTTDAQAAKDNQEKTFTQKELTRIVARETEKAKAAALKELQDKQAEAEMSEVDRLKKQLAETEMRAAQLERDRLIDRIATENNLPPELRDRLRGDDEDALREDAKTLAKFAAPKREAPNSESQRRGNSDAVVSDEEMQSIARMMGLKVPAAQSH